MSGWGDVTSRASLERAGCTTWLNRSPSNIGSGRPFDQMRECGALRGVFAVNAPI